MFNHEVVSDHSNRSLQLRHALVAAFRSLKQNLPATPASLTTLLTASQEGMSSLSAKPAVRQAIADIQARLFQIPGREIEAWAAWHDSLATAVFAARVAQLKSAAVHAAFCGGLLYRAGEALALKILAHVELDFRMKVDGAARREWCMSHDADLAERLMRSWKLPPEVGACVIGWRKFGEFEQVSGESTALYIGRLLATELLNPQFCVPGAIEYTAREIGLTPEALQEVRAQADHVRALISTP